MSEKTIRPEAPGLGVYLRRVYQYRRLILVLAGRDLKAQYAQSVLGIFWALIKPIIALIIFSIFFGVLLPFDAEIPVAYPLFAFSGMVSWYYFTFLMINAGVSVTSSQDIIKRIYFPKLILPLSKVLTGLVEFGISMALLVVMMFIYGEVPGPQIVFFPVFLLLNIMVGLSVGIWMAALATRYRDLQHLLPYLVNFLIWLTPVFYPGTLIPERYAHFLYLNPMAGVIAGFRWTLLGDAAPAWEYGLGMIPVLILFLSGVWYFQRVERQMVDWA